MNSKTMIAIAIVAVLVIGGSVGIMIVNKNNDGDKVRSSNNLDGRLTVFGNANNDDFLDSRDVNEVKAIIAGEKEATYYDCLKSYGGSVVKRSFADANVDGKIDNADVDWIQNMVERKNNMLIYFYDVDGVIGSCTYPLTTAAVGYKSNYESMIIIGAQDQVKYVCNQVGNDGPYHQWFRVFDGATCFGSRFTPDYEIFAKAGNDKPSFMLSGTRIWFDANMEETCGPLGIDVVRLPFWEDNWTIPAIITLGYLTGHEDRAYEYAETADSVYETIKTAIENFPLSERPLVYASYSYNTISGMHSGVHELVNLAGGRTVIDAGYSKGSIDAEGIYTMNPDWLISSQYFGFMETWKDRDSCQNSMFEQYGNTDGKYEKLIMNTDAYKNNRVLLFNQGVFMGTASYVACAYLANHLYPDKFHFDVDGLFTDYLAKYHPDHNIEEFRNINYLDLGTYKELTAGS